MHSPTSKNSTGSPYTTQENPPPPGGTEMGRNNTDEQEGASEIGRTVRPSGCTGHNRYTGPKRSLAP